MMKMKWAVCSAVLLGMLGGCGGDDAPATGSVNVLSSRADLVTNGDALIEVIPASGISRDGVRIDVNGRDVTLAFATGQDGRLVGLVTGLVVGSNVVTATSREGSASTVKITNRANGTPLLYGPQITPWACDPGALDAACNRQVTYSLLYKSTDASKTALLPYDPASVPKDIASTTTDAGVTVPFVVRLETGVINRDYYNIAVLFDPAKPWAPTAPQTGWNRKVVYMHGAGYGMGYGQNNGVSGTNILNVYALSRGFAVASSALNDTGHDGNVVVQAESMLELRERVTEAYGEVRYAIGMGNSGGALAQQWVANAYPGIYDGIVVGYSFLDVGSVGVEIEDCALLRSYFTTPSKWASGVSWSIEQQRAANGQLGDACVAWINSTARLGLPGDFGYPNMWNPSTRGVIAFPGLSPTSLGGCDAPEALIYSASNPGGIRCTAQDYVVGLMGHRAADGFANRPYSNAGVQFGLKALLAGTITPAMFVDLNEKIGSHTIDYAFQNSRVAADAPAIGASYRTGWVNAANGMSTIPILDIRVPDVSTNHHHFRSWAMRERLDRAQGHHRNHVIWYDTTRTANQTLDAMDAWLSAIKADRSTESLANKVASNRPPSLTDLCGAADGTRMTMLECTKGQDDGSPRVAAGGPVSDDVIQCVLAPLDRSKYPASLTDALWARLQATFSTGVCNYAVAGVDQQQTRLWQTYLKSDGSVEYGGTPLPASP